MHYISELIQGAVKEIYLSMLSLPVEVLEGDDCALYPFSPEGLTVRMDLTGQLQGSLSMTYDADLARNITFSMMGEMPASAAATEVGDVLGEMSNMIAGGFKAKLAAKGVSCQASAPKFCPNSEFTPYSVTGGINLTNRMKLPISNGELSVRILAQPIAA